MDDVIPERYWRELVRRLAAAGVDLDGPLTAELAERYYPKREWLERVRASAPSET